MNKYFTLLLIFLAHWVNAQEKPLELKKALADLEANATVLKIQQKNIDAVKEQLLASKQNFLPQVGLQYTGIYTNSPLNSFGIKLEQQVVEQADFDPSLLNNPDGISNFNTKLRVVQPLFNYDAQLAKTALAYQLESVELQNTHTLNHLKVKLKDAYVQLQLLYATKQVLTQSEETLKTHQKLIANFVEQGIGKRTDALAIEVKLKTIDNQKVIVDMNISQLSDYVAYLTGSEAVIYKPTTEIDELESAMTANAVDDSRADFMAFQKGIEAQKISLQMTKARNLPRLNAFGEFNLNDASPVGFGANNFMIGATLSWQLHLGKQLKSEVAQKKLGIEKSSLLLADMKAQSNLELRKALSQKIALEQQIKNMESSLTLSEEQLRIMENRFKEGLEKSADVLVAENQLSQTKLEIKHLYAQLNQTHHQIEFLVK